MFYKYATAILMLFFVSVSYASSVNSCATLNGPGPGSVGGCSVSGSNVVDVMWTISGGAITSVSSQGNSFILTYQCFGDGAEGAVNAMITFSDGSTAVSTDGAECAAPGGGNGNQPDACQFAPPGECVVPFCFGFNCEDDDETAGGGE